MTLAVDAPATLTTAETVELESHEAVIERGLQTFYEVGTALLAIRDKRLYRAGYPTFEAYCLERWQLKRQRAYELMDAAQVTANLSEISDILPSRESHTVPLTTLEPEAQRVVWEVVQQTAPAGKVTAAHVQSVAQVFKEVVTTGEPVAVVDMVKAAVNARKSVLSTCPEAVIQFCKQHSITEPDRIAAWAAVYANNRRFWDDAQRGYILNLDGDDTSVSEADATLIRLANNEDEYERAKRHETYKRNAAAEKERRKAEKLERQTTVPADLPDVDDRYRLIAGDMRLVLPQLPDETFEAIITDPPYPQEFLDLYDVLAREGARLLKPGGIMAVMCGQSYLPQIMTLMSLHLEYHWTYAYLTPGGQSPQIWPRKVNTFWKPVLTFTKGAYVGDWTGDVIKSDANDKRFHEWGQSESGTADMLTRFTLPGQRILDPFLGGGTTALVALQLNRLVTGVDSDPRSIETTKARIAAWNNQ